MLESAIALNRPNLENKRPHFTSPNPVPAIGQSQNRELLAQLERERNFVATLYWGATIGLLSGFAFSNVFLSVLPLAGFHSLLRRLQKLAQLIKIASVIVDAFEDTGVEVFPSVPIDDNEPVDLFVRFPHKEFILIAIRSFGQASIHFNEKAQAIYFRLKKKKAGFQRWRPEPLAQLYEQETWLRKHRRDLFGGSSRDSRRFAIKALVVWEKSSIGRHREELYAEMEGEKFLRVAREQGGTFYVVEERQIVDFVRAYLAFRANLAQQKQASKRSEVQSSSGENDPANVE